MRKTECSKRQRSATRTWPRLWATDVDNKLIFNPRSKMPSWFFQDGLNREWLGSSLSLSVVTWHCPNKVSLWKKEKKESSDFRTGWVRTAFLKSELRSLPRVYYRAGVTKGNLVYFSLDFPCRYLPVYYNRYNKGYFLGVNFWVMAVTMATSHLMTGGYVLIFT